MASDTNLSRIEKENSVLFGLKWSMVGLSLALLLLAGCSSLFDQRVPRYNTVEGPRRVPIHNPGGGQGQPTPQAIQQQAQQVYQQPAPMVRQQPAPTPMPVQQQTYQPPQDQSLWGDVTGLFTGDDTAQPQPAPLPMTRQAPITQPAPQPMPMAQPQRNAMARDVETQINALEAELDAADARRGQVTREAQDDGWPDLGVTDMFSSNSAPAQPAVAQSSGYQVVKLPPPPPRGTIGAGYQPIAAAGVSAPMPPMISAPRVNAMADAPVRQEVQPSIDVPLAPDIHLTSPQSVNVPVSLIPPSAAGADGSYLPDSRYTGRSYQSYGARY